jgi:SAM-dependent methyltransferase
VETERFDVQAQSFDDRAGIPARAAATAARAMLNLTSAGVGDLVVELGAGTGEIGLHLARFTKYIGLDRSRGMLDAFRAKLDAAPQTEARLVHADADDTWPVETGSASVVFASRVAHLLNPDHLCNELRRVCAPGGFFLIAHVSRDELSVKRLLRDRREALLREREFTPRARADLAGSVLERLLAAGATRIEARPVAAWSAQASANEVLDGWRRVPSMGGGVLDDATRGEILAELLQWTRRELGDPDTVHVWQERYMIEGARLEVGASTSHC